MIKIADSHNDFMTKITAKEKDCYLSHCQKVGVKIISCAIFTTNSKLNISDISNFNNELTTLNKKFKDKIRKLYIMKNRLIISKL